MGARALSSWTVGSVEAKRLAARLVGSVSAPGGAAVWLLLALVPGLGSAQEAAPRRLGWYAGAGPRLQGFAGGGYNELGNRRATFGTGIGAEVFVGYGFTRSLAARLAVSTASHDISAPGASSGAAWVAGDAILRWPLEVPPLGSFDVQTFARIGKQAVTADNVDLDGGGLRSNHAWSGFMIGGGAGVRWWATARVSLRMEFSYAYVRIDGEVEDPTGHHTPLERTLDGSTWGVTPVAVSYHW